MKRHLIQILTILIVTSCQTNNVKQEQIMTEIQKSDCNFTNSKTYNIDKIIQGQKEELENGNIKENFNTLIDQKLQFLNLRRESDNKLFQY